MDYLIGNYSLTGALFSPDRKHRYGLWRYWDLTRPLLLFIGLNPSTANESINDPTVIRCIERAKQKDFGGLLVGNLFSMVSTDPSLLLNDNDSWRVGTDLYLLKMIEMAGWVLCGWGSFRAVRERAGKVLNMIPVPYCLGINSDGQPKHPLYISYQTPMIKLSSGCSKNGGYRPERKLEPISCSSKNDLL